ncbi:hypothetical protein GCG21_13700 [Pseudactinotalea sp. HY160]|uniref:hypothetical protein n=1 Tax=Pseudactinotalea sp. HY160 TaxID=2654490 RepID=UPI00128CF96D|nr:hypothetical protein [Pseudactinotalea sp. HY160]MPV51041.1 hypothetical protein [Pseudactinotalea sp. HY160]
MKTPTKASRIAAATAAASLLIAANATASWAGEPPAETEDVVTADAPDPGEEDHSEEAQSEEDQATDEPAANEPADNEAGGDEPAGVDQDDSGDQPDAGESDVSQSDAGQAEDPASDPADEDPADEDPAREDAADEEASGDDEDPSVKEPQAPAASTPQQAHSQEAQQQNQAQQSQAQGSPRAAAAKADFDLAGTKAKLLAERDRLGHRNYQTGDSCSLSQVLWTTNDAETMIAVGPGFKEYDAIIAPTETVRIEMSIGRPPGGTMDTMEIAVYLCTPAITPKAPTFDDVDGDQDTITIPSQSGVSYELDGVPVDAGTYPVAYGSSPQAFVTVTAHAAGDRELTGTTSWEREFDGRTTVATQAVTGQDMPGTSQDTFTVPDVEGIVYELAGSEVDPGTHQVDLSAYDAATEEANLAFTAVPASAWHRLSGETSWTVTATLRTLITAEVAPTFNERDGRDNDTFVIPDVEGITYELGGSVIEAGEYSVGDEIGYGSNDLATAQVTATVASGYRHPGGDVQSWTGEFDSRLIADAPSAPQFEDADGFTGDTVTVPETKGVDYLIDGEVVTGTVNVGRNAGGLYDVVVEAQPREGYKILDGQDRSFTVELDSRVTAGQPQAATSSDLPGHDEDAYVVPAIDGIVFTIGGIEVAPGSYTFDESAYDADTEVAHLVLTAGLADNTKLPSGLDLADYDQSVTATLRTEVSIPEPGTSDVDGIGDDRISLPDAEGVTWLVNGIEVPAGEFATSADDYDMFATYTVQAVAADGYVFAGLNETGPEQSFTFDSRVGAEPQAPTAEDASGGTSDTYTVPEVEGVDYVDAEGQIVEAGTYIVFGYGPDGTVTFELTAIAQDGYRLDVDGVEAVSVDYSFTFDNLTHVTPVAPEFTDSDGADQDSYTVPATAGVEYLIDGNVAEAGTYPGSGTVTITARALDGFKVTGTSEWSFTFDPTAASTGDPEQGGLESMDSTVSTSVNQSGNTAGSPQADMSGVPTGADVSSSGLIALVMGGLGGALLAVRRKLTAGQQR